MAWRRTTPERLGWFSDGVFTIAITIMVFQLKPPEGSTFTALLALWPTGLSYVASYCFIAIVWLNHNHLFRFFPYVTPRLVWTNFVHLLMVLLIPFSTAWVASTKFAAVPVLLMQRFLYLSTWLTSPSSAMQSLSRLTSWSQPGHDDSP